MCKSLLENTQALLHRGLQGGTLNIYLCVVAFQLGDPPDGSGQSLLDLLGGVRLPVRGERRNVLQGQDPLVQAARGKIHGRLQPLHLGGKRIGLRS